MKTTEQENVKLQLENYNKNIQSLLFANPYSHGIKDEKGNLICCFCEDEKHIEKYKEYIPVYKKVLNAEIERIKKFFENEDNDFESRLKFAFNIKGWEEHKPVNASFSFNISSLKGNIDEVFIQEYLNIGKDKTILLKKEFRIKNNEYLCPTYLGTINNEVSDFTIDLTPKNNEEVGLIKGWFGHYISHFYFDFYKNSDLDKTYSRKSLPFKYSLDKENVVYFYNPDLMGLFDFNFIVNNMGRRFNPSIFLDAYKEGFKRGLCNLEKEYQIKLADFYDQNKKDRLIETMKYILYEKLMDSNTHSDKGLICKVRGVPLIWTHKSIEKSAFYNGYFHSIVELESQLGLDFDNKPDTQYIQQAEITEAKSENIISEESNPYPHIFKDKKAFDFFERLMEEFDIKKSRSQVSDITDIYVLMKKDNYILESFKPVPFVNWLNERYEYFSATRLETVSSRTTPKAKYKIYNNSKQLFYKTSA